MNELIDCLDDILIEFDEMGFVPTNYPHDHNSEFYAIDWKNRLINALAGYRKSEWISVEDRLPDKYGDVICCTRKGTIWQVTYNPTYKLFNVSYDNVENAMDVTHWMPLPEPPKTKGGAEQ